MALVLILVLLALGALLVQVLRSPSLFIGRCIGFVLKVLFRNASVAATVPWGLEGISFKIFKRTSPLLYIELKAQVQPSYTVRTPRASAPTPTASKLPLVLRILQLPFVQKFLVFCLRAFELSISDTRVELAHEDGSLVLSVGALLLATQRNAESAESKEFSRYTVALLTLSHASVSFEQLRATYELFALRGLRIGVGFDAPRLRRLLEMVSLEVTLDAIEARLDERAASPMASFLRRMLEQITPVSITLPTPGLKRAVPAVPPPPAAAPWEWTTSSFAFLIPNKGVMLSVKHIGARFEGRTTSLGLATRLEAHGSCCSDHALGIDATFSLHQTALAALAERSEPYLSLPLVQVRTVAELSPPSETARTTRLGFELHVTVVEASAHYAHLLVSALIAVARSISLIVSASVIPDAVESSPQPPVPSVPSQLTVTLRSATARVASVALMVSNHDEAALHLTVEKIQASLQEVGNAFQGGIEVTQLSLSLPGLSVDRRAMAPAVEDGRVPGIVLALSTINGSLTQGHGEPPSLTLDVSTVLAEVNTQLVERLMRLALGLRRLQVLEEAYTCPPLVLPDRPAAAATPVVPPLHCSVWLHDAALFVAGDVSDFRPSAPLLKLSLPLSCVKIAPDAPQFTLKLHDVGVLHMGEADRVIMKKQRISEVAPLLSLDHLAVTLSFTDSRHAALDITTERLKLQWTPAAHLSTVHLLVGLAETAFLFPPLPVLPQPYVVPAVASGPPFVLSVSGKLTQIDLNARCAQISALKVYIGCLRLFKSRVAHISSGTLFMGMKQYEHLILPSVYVFLKEAPYDRCINLFLDARDPCWRIPFEFDFGETLNEILVVGKAVAGSTAADIVALLDRVAKVHRWPKAAPSTAPDQPHKLIFEGSLTNPRGELVDDPLQVSLQNFWKVSQDEVVERRARFEQLEQRLAALKLQLPSDAEFKALRARAMAKLAEEDSRIYCQRARLAREQETSLLWCASSALLHARVGIDIGDEFLTQRLLDLHRRSICFPDENLPKWDLILGLNYRVWGNDVVNLVIRDYPLPFVQVQAPVEVHGTATFAEEVPPPSALVQYRLNVSPSFAPTCVKTLTSVKIYYDMAGACDGVVVTLGVGYRGGVGDMGSVFALMSPESSDWCPLLPWWDKMRQVLHGQLMVNANKVLINYSGNIDPYNVQDVLEIHLERADVLLKAECLSIAAGRFGIKTATHPTFMLDSGDFEATVKWAWHTRGNPHNHWVVPNKQNLADTDPIEMDVAYDACPFRPFVPGWQEPPPPSWPIIDHQAEYRSHGLSWDIALVLGPHKPQQPMFTLHPSMINWFMRFGRNASFPSLWVQETVFRRAASGALFGAVMDSLKLSLKLPRRTAFRFWEAKDQKKPLGFEVSVEELDLAIALEKVESEPGKEKKWALQTRPMVARNINATVLTPEGAARWEAAHASHPVPYDGDFLCSVPRASLTKHVGESGAKCDRYRLESPKLQWTKDARNAVYSWLDRFHQWRITLSYSSAVDARKDVEAAPAAAATAASPAAPRKQTPALLSPRGPPPPASQALQGAASANKDQTSRELGTLFSEDASLPEEARNFFRVGGEAARSPKDKVFELEVTEPRIILRAEEAKGVLVFVGESLNLRGVSSVHREASATRELTVLSLAWNGFSAHIAPTVDMELSLQSLRTQEEKCVIAPCRLELGMTYSLSDTEDELERDKDANIVKINIPQFNVSLSSAQFQVLSAIINYLLLESSNASSARDRDDQYASIMFKSQLEGGVKESLPKVRERTRRLRAELKDLETQLTDIRAEGKAPEEDMAALEREVRVKRKAYLRSDEMLKGLILSQRRIRAAQQVLAKTLTFKVEVLLGRVKWSLLLGSENAPFADATATRFDCVIMFYEDQSAVYRFELGEMDIQNRLPGAQHRNMLQLLNPQKWGPKDVMLRLFAEQRAPVGGIFVYDHWEVNLAPVNLQVSQGVYESLFEYFFPPSEEKLQEASTYEAKKQEEEEEEYDIKAKGLTDVEQMKLRARWFRSFVYIKITETEVGVTFKTLIEKLRLKLHPLVYNGRTWTFKELLGTLKKDIIWNLLFQAPSFVRAFTSSSGNAKEEKKPEEPAQPGALDALKRRLLLGETSPKSKGKKTERSASGAPTPTPTLLPGPALERNNSRKGSEPPSLSIASPSTSSSSPPHSAAADGTPRRTASTSALPAAEAEIEALMIEFGFASPPDAPPSEP